MTAAFFERDTLFEKACLHFGAAGSVRSSTKPDKQKAAKREKIDRTIQKFRRVMSSANPPQTQQEAVEAIAPILSLLLSVIFKQFVVELIEWLWDETSGPEAQVIAGVERGGIES